MTRNIQRGPPRPPSGPLVSLGHHAAAGLLGPTTRPWWASSLPEDQCNRGDHDQAQQTLPHQGRRVRGPQAPGDPVQQFRFREWPSPMPKDSHSTPDSRAVRAASASRAAASPRAATAPGTLRHRIGRSTPVRKCEPLGCARAISRRAGSVSECPGRWRPGRPSGSRGCLGAAGCRRAGPRAHLTAPRQVCIAKGCLSLRKND